VRVPRSRLQLSALGAVISTFSPDRLGEQAFSSFYRTIGNASVVEKGSAPFRLGGTWRPRDAVGPAVDGSALGKTWGSGSIHAFAGFSSGELVAPTKPA
jgi:hypothetical protein